MLIALTQKNEHVQAIKVYKGKKTDTGERDIYSCPSCRQPVFLKSGNVKVPHFAHYKKSNCQVFSEGETIEHLEGKQDLFEWFQRQHIPVQLEGYIPRLHQRPDLLVWPHNGKPVAIEFQCSSLSPERMLERTKGYLESGYEVYWVLGKKFHISDHLTSFQRLFVRETKELGYYLIQYDTVTRSLQFLHHLAAIPHKNTVQLQKKYFDLRKERNNLEHIQKEIQCLELVSDNRSRIRQGQFLLDSQKRLNKGRVYQEPEMVEFQKYIYRHGYSLISLPLEVYLPVEEEILIKTLPIFWKFVLLHWMIQKGINKSFTLTELTHLFQVLVANNMVNLHFMPFVSQEKERRICLSYVKVLISQGILVQVEKTKWRVHKRPYIYASEYEKLQSFYAFKLDTD